MFDHHQWGVAFGILGKTNNMSAYLRLPFLFILVLFGPLFFSFQKKESNHISESYEFSFSLLKHLVLAWFIYILQYSTQLILSGCGQNDD